MWLRLSSTDGNVVTPSYSTDGATWLPITTSGGTAAPRDLTSIASPKVGLLALGATAAGGADNLTAKFDYFLITPDSTAVPCATPCQVEQFNGTALDLTRWDDSVRLNASLTVADGTLNIPLTNSDIYQTTNTTPNIVLQDLPGGAFVATTKVTLNAIRGYQQAGLIIYGDDNNYLKLVYSGRSTAAAGSKAANVIQFAKEVNATASESNSTALGAAFPDTVWLRMSSTDGNVVTPTYSTDGTTWLPITTSGGTAAPRDLTSITTPKVGLLALGATAAGGADNLIAKFDYFTLGKDDTCKPPPVADTTAPTTTHTIPAANAAGWYTTRPSFTLAASDGAGGSGVASTEYRIAGGAWTPYTAAVSVTGEGTRLIEYRSTDTAGNVEAIKSLSVKIDTVNPTVSGTTTGEATKTVTLTASDATSTVATIEYKIDGAATWTTYTTPLTFNDPGTYAVAYRATDVAGNVASGELSVFVPTPDTTAPTTTHTIPAANAAGWYTTRPSFTLAASDGAGGSGVASTEYRIAGGAWTPYTAAVSVTGEGTRLIEYRSTDTAGNVEAIKSLSVKIDTVNPTVSAAVSGTTTKTVTLTATDATSGVAGIEYQIGDAATWTTYSTPLTFSNPAPTSCATAPPTRRATRHGRAVHRRREEGLGPPTW